jgi:predicted transcriptional regulator
MFLPPIQEVKKRRIALGLSQKNLADSVNVSQSLIAKIENNRVQPSYEVIRRIFEFFDHIEQPSVGLAKDIETRNVVWLRRNDKVRDAADKMREFGFSQLPIRDDKEEICVGSISERQIVQSVLKEADPKAFYDRAVGEVMGDQFAVVDENIPISAVALLLQHSQAVLTARKGRIVGIITPTDLLIATAKERSRRKSSLADPT